MFKVWIKSCVATLIHHITTLREPYELGITRIAKILWLSDIEYFRKTGRTITQSDDYVKDDHGPRHKELYSAINELKKEGKLAERLAPTPVGDRRELLYLSVPDMSDFSADEIATVDRITALVAAMSAKQASLTTHDELWDAAYFNERIPVAAAAPVDGALTPEVLEWAESVFDEHRAAG